MVRGVGAFTNDDDKEKDMSNEQEKKVVAVPMYDDALLEAQQDERELREIFERQQRWSNYPI